MIRQEVTKRYNPVGRYALALVYLPAGFLFKTKDMNKEALLKAADWLEKRVTDESKFDMGDFRDDYENYKNYKSHTCNSVGCAIGYLVELVDENDVPRRLGGRILFEKVSEILFGFDDTMDEWLYMFAGLWKYIDNTARGVAQRMRLIATKGLPEDWREQMQGIKPLSYE